MRFKRVTVPKGKPAPLFGAVKVVSCHISERSKMRRMKTSSM